LNNAGFNILRSETKDGEFQVINAKGIIAGHGTTSEKHVYTYTDTTAKLNVVSYYQIEDVSLNGDRTTLRTTICAGMSVQVVNSQRVGVSQNRLANRSDTKVVQGSGLRLAALFF